MIWHIFHIYLRLVITVSQPVLVDSDVLKLFKPADETEGFTSLENVVEETKWLF